MYTEFLCQKTGDLSLTSQDSQPTPGNIHPSGNQIQNSHYLFSSMEELSMQKPPGAVLADLASVLL